MNKLFGLILILSSVFFQITISHSAPYWVKTYGESNADGASYIQEITDGGYIMAGQTTSFGVGDYDVWIIKLDSNGNVIWQKTYGGIFGDYALSIQETSDSNYIVAGNTNVISSIQGDAWIIKLDSSGNVIWQKAYGGNDFDALYSIQETTDGGYIVAGVTGYRDAWIMKLDNSGNVIWQKTYGGNDLESANSIQETTDGDYIVAGSTSSFGAGYRDAWIIKLDSSGNVIWQKTYGGDDFDGLNSIQETTDGDFVVAGYTASFGAGDHDTWIMKLDSSGNVIWQKTFGGSGYDAMEGTFIQETTDGEYIVAGGINSFGGGFLDAWIIKLDISGNVIWQKTFVGSNVENAQFIQETTDGGFVVAGFTLSFGAGSMDAFVLKLDSNGTIPDCNIMRTSNVIITDTAVNPQNTNAIITDISVTPNDTTITPVDSSARIITVCVDNAIPTLSEWGIILFMTIILGIGVLMLCRRREI